MYASKGMNVGKPVAGIDGFDITIDGTPYRVAKVGNGKYLTWTWNQYDGWLSLPIDTPIIDAIAREISAWNWPT